VERALSRQRARGRLSSFLEELGAVVGRDREVDLILHDVQRSQKLKGHLGGLLQGRGRVDAETALVDPPRTVEFLEVLAETIETKDHFIRGHARRVAFYASLLADRLCLSAEEQARVRIAAFLHDIGKVGVPTDLLMRNGGLAENERKIVEQHAEIGSRLLKPLDIPPSVATAIRHHHEWWDGTGYPDGLVGEEIPLIARIIAVTDSFDTMACDRPYRAALDRNAIHGEFRRFSGVQFDPELVKEFFGILETGVCDLDPELFAEIITKTPESASAEATAS
jgi:putative nucleotidyltransferase with HDIG domain